ncbi:hypothetical protein FISHEDRAFT_35658 [Fistulina hepatica ATCC 64428]|uniref:DUF3669 domain-containing protein n=1 Tax=Fistulina hepatica ATCC 64428 TaxID=1128425 RepID=A0A0D7AJY3_9AGAR|nr:hypothetical protein FISHEDRAFT_35658 [Fistulina hepatica ATCC 64428]
MQIENVDEPDKLVTLGSGSFAKVYCYRGSPYVFKQVHHPENANVLLKEYRFCDRIYLQCNSTSYFALPRALAVHLPATERDAAVPAVPLTFGKAVQELFFPPNVQSKGPNLCRLYFGKTFVEQLSESSRPRFFNSSNFPLDAARYTQLRRRFPRELDSIENVAHGMGEMLGRLHGRAGVDGRDVEFVLGGDGMFGCSYWVIDFNQVREWNKTEDDIATLVSAFFSNDPYYPRPRPNDSLYQSFKKGYQEAFVQISSSGMPFADLFLQAIEQEQARRDAAVQV